jgi:hypothetical protein
MFLKIITTKTTAMLGIHRRLGFEWETENIASRQTKYVIFRNL